MILNRHNFNLALLVLGYCLTRCIAPSMSKKADKFGLLEDVDQDACTAKTGPCPFQICPGDFFRAICDQFSLLKTTTHPLKLTDLHNDSVCCKNGDCSDLITNADTEAACSVTQEELVDAIKDTTNCFTSANCVIQHPESLARLEKKVCNLTMKIVNGFYYCT
ncbi:hypothetical protein BOX15_Mlig024047g1 [Macrostomum lignano]|uniref:Uncharacterized protein n=2 Tax=Macrostomum lignano TaxID=282301 RepID=A0A267GQP9_9PLAT|nr:hypothetical protein BOX15_Mlig024047g2 [Macrostomum lignano]PAA88036.1 hypothetical protein BOX15_Mlig024047g1 [Macrostomum lignano]